MEQVILAGSSYTIYGLWWTWRSHEEILRIIWNSIIIFATQIMHSTDQRHERYAWRKQCNISMMNPHSHFALTSTAQGVSFFLLLIRLIWLFSHRKLLVVRRKIEQPLTFSLSDKKRRKGRKRYKTDSTHKIFIHFILFWQVDLTNRRKTFFPRQAQF